MTDFDTLVNWKANAIVHAARFTQVEIAEMWHCSEKTVQRKLHGKAPIKGLELMALINNAMNIIQAISTACMLTTTEEAK